LGQELRPNIWDVVVLSFVFGHHTIPGFGVITATPIAARAPSLSSASNHSLLRLRK
jgi:hypothetical protein